MVTANVELSFYMLVGLIVATTCPCQGTKECLDDLVTDITVKPEEKTVTDIFDLNDFNSPPLHLNFPSSKR